MITTTQIIHDKAGNVSSKILTVLDKDGTIVELVDMLAYQAQQELEQKQQAFLDSLSASRTLDDGGMTMMAMSSPEAPTSRLDEFGYDHLGNRTTVYLNKGVMAQETQEYAHNSVNQYSTINSTILGLPLGGAVEYDDNGNLATDKEGYGYSYDYRNRIEEIEEVVQFSYDALGRRIRKTDCQSNITTYYIYDPDNRIIAQYTQPLNDEAALDRTFVYGNDLHEVLAMYLARHEGNPADWDAFLEFVDAWLCTDPNDACYNGAYDHNSDNIVNLKDFAYYSGIWNMPSNRESNWYYLHDVQGSVMGVIGGRLNRPEDREFYTYDVYGNPSSLSAIGNPFMFHGKFVASTQPLIYSRFYRDYQPGLGRWMQFDPINTYDSMNLFEFTRSNPTNYIDPFGLSSIYWTPGGVGFPVEYQQVRVSAPVPSESAVQLRNNAINALQELASSHQKYDYYPLTGLQDLIDNKLIPALQWLSAFQYEVLSEGNDPQYSTYWGSRKLSLPEAISSTSIIHEAVHVYNDMSKLFIGNRKDEGMAYAAEYMIDKSTALRNLENELRKDSPSKSTLQRSWSNFWRNANSTVGTSGVYYTLGFPINFLVTEKDVSNVSSHLGFQYKCQQLAKHYNSVLKKNPNIKCAEFVCEVRPKFPDIDMTIPVELHSVFK